MSKSDFTFKIRRLWSLITFKVVRTFSAIFKILTILTVLAIVFYQEDIYKFVIERLSSVSDVSITDTTKISISGNKRTSDEQIKYALRKVQTKNAELGLSFSSSNSEKLYKDLIAELPWVKEIVIRFYLPDTVRVFIVEYEPFAIWKDSSSTYVIDRDGNQIPISDLSEFENLIVIYGKNANMHSRSLFNIITADLDFSSNIESATWIGNRRWDIKFIGGTLVRLPADNINKEWWKIVEMHKSGKVITDFRVIDLRVEGRMYLIPR